MPQTCCKVEEGMQTILPLPLHPSLFRDHKDSHGYQTTSHPWSRQHCIKLWWEQLNLSSAERLISSCDCSLEGSERVLWIVVCSERVTSFVDNIQELLTRSSSTFHSTSHHITSHRIYPCKKLYNTIYHIYIYIYVCVHLQVYAVHARNTKECVDPCSAIHHSFTTKLANAPRIPPK